MIWWDGKLKERLRENNITCLLMKRYVDDITLILSNESLTETNRKEDENIMKKVQEIGNNIHSTIQYNWR